MRILTRFENTLAACVPYSLAALVMRLGIARVFWASGQTKVEGFRLRDTAIALFADEYRLPLIPPGTAATMAAIAEHVFPILLVLGLFTRLSAFALLVMTAVIQFLVYPESWPVHILWAGVLLGLISQGAGKWSLDALYRKR